MFERYREDAGRAIFFSRWEALQSGCSYIEPKHLLIAVVREAGSKANQLFDLTASGETFRKGLGVPLRNSDQPIKEKDLPLSNAAKRVLAYTAEEADQLSSTPIGTEHLLLGLLREKKSDVPEALAKAGIDLRSARNLIRQDMGQHLLEREPDDKEAPLKSLRPFAAFLLLVVVLSLIYLIVRLVNF
jgi:ATP-dependent Clp protease ATP-binding subunit ClpC